MTMLEGVDRASSYGFSRYMYLGNLILSTKMNCVATPLQDTHEFA